MAYRTNIQQLLREEKLPRRMFPSVVIALDDAVLIGLTTVILISMIAKSAFCEEAPEETTESPRRAIVEHQGASGFWFRRDVALEMLADLQELPLRRRELALLEEQLELREGQVERLREMVGLEREAVERAMEAVVAAERRAAEAEEARDKWWRSPLFLVSMGALITVVLEVAAVVVFAYVSPG